MKDFNCGGNKTERNYELFGITGVPHFAIIDPEGKLILNRLPYVSKGVIYKILNNLLERR